MCLEDRLLAQFLGDLVEVVGLGELVFDGLVEIALTKVLLVKHLRLDDEHAIVVLKVEVVVDVKLKDEFLGGV